MERAEVVNYLNSCLLRPSNINRADIAWLCTVISNETGKTFNAEDVTKAARVSPNTFMRFIEAMWGFLVAKYQITVHTDPGTTMVTTATDGQLTKIVKYS